jgi:hypothetical protein
MRYGGFLQRRLVRLESTIKAPDQQEIDNRVVAQALSNLSIEDLRRLRDGALRQAAGAVGGSNPEYDEVLQRANALCVQALEEYNASVGKARAIHDG